MTDENDDDGRIVDREWFKTQFDAKGLSQVRVGELIGKKQNPMNSLLAGATRPDVSNILDLHKLLGAPPSEIVRRFGYAWPKTECPVIGQVDHRAKVRFIHLSPPETIEAPTENATELKALEVATANTALDLLSGNVLFYEPRDYVDPAAFGRLSVLELDGEPAPVVGILGRDKVVTYGGLAEITATRLKTASPIRWQRSC